VRDADDEPHVPLEQPVHRLPAPLGGPLKGGPLVRGQHVAAGGEPVHRLPPVRDARRQSGYFRRVQHPRRHRLVRHAY